MWVPVSCVLFHHNVLVGLCVFVYLCLYLYVGPVPPHVCQRQLKEATSALPQPCSNLMTHIWYHLITYFTYNILHFTYNLLGGDDDSDSYMIEVITWLWWSFCQCWWYGGEMKTRMMTGMLKTGMMTMAGLILKNQSDDMRVKWWWWPRWRWPRWWWQGWYERTKVCLSSLSL